MSIKVPITPSPPSTPDVVDSLGYSQATSTCPASPYGTACRRPAVYIKLADLAALYHIDPSTCHVSHAAEDTEHSEDDVAKAEKLGDKPVSFPVASDLNTVSNEHFKVYSRKIPPSGGYNLCLLVGSIKVVVDKLRVDSSRVRLAEVLVGDETGTVSLRARDDQIDLSESLASIKAGENQGGAVVLRNCTVELFHNKYLRLAVTKWGKMTPYPDHVASTPKPPTNMNTELNYSLADLSARNFIHQVDDDVGSPQSSRATIPRDAIAEKSPSSSYPFHSQHIQYAWGTSSSAYPPPHSPTFYGGWKQPYRPSAPYASYSTPLLSNASLEDPTLRINISSPTAGLAFGRNPRGSWTNQQKHYQRKGPRQRQDRSITQQGRGLGNQYHPSGPTHDPGQHRYYQPHRTHVYSAPQHFTQHLYSTHQRPSDSTAQYMHPQYFNPQYSHPHQRMPRQLAPSPPFPVVASGDSVSDPRRTFNPATESGTSTNAPHTPSQPLFPHQAAQTDSKGSYTINPNDAEAGNNDPVPMNRNMGTSSAGSVEMTSSSPSAQHDIYYQHTEQARILSLGSWLETYRPFSDVPVAISMPELGDRNDNPIATGQNQQIASEFARREAQAVWQLQQQQNYNPHQPSFQPYYAYPHPHARMVYASHEEVAYSFDSAFTADESSYGATSEAGGPGKSDSNTRDGEKSAEYKKHT